MAPTRTWPEWGKIAGYDRVLELQGRVDSVARGGRRGRCPRSRPTPPHVPSVTVAPDRRVKTWRNLWPRTRLSVGDEPITRAAAILVAHRGTPCRFTLVREARLPRPAHGRLS